MNRARPDTFVSTESPADKMFHFHLAENGTSVKTEIIAGSSVNLLCGHRERVNPILIVASLLFLAKYPFL